METLDTKDIQGLLLRAYKDLPSSCFFLCQATDSASYKQFFKFILPSVTNSEKNPKEEAVNMAFTSKGIALLDVQMKKDFSSEFLEGMKSEVRQRILGDYNRNDPKHWHWGSVQKPVIHFVLMLYAANRDSLETKRKGISEKLHECKITEVKVLESEELVGDKEHFGFHDGVSQPVMKRLKHKKKGSEFNVVADGEFIFGYHNEYDKLPVSPESMNFVLGKNGSYMVFRQIKQDVKGFWEYMSSKSNGNITGAIHLASKMMGRFPDGTPLVLSPEGPNPELSNASDFGYYKHDKFGEKCPIGSHIRKANPRDGMNDNIEESTRVANRHRILRRGRPYGEPVAPSLEPEDILKAPPTEKEAGLLFICFNTNISRQFEFVQQQWMNNQKFDHLYNDPDPIIGIDEKPPAHGKNKSDQLGDFTLQRCPVREKYSDVPQFTFLKGGAYFFFPGISAIQYLSEL